MDALKAASALALVNERVIEYIFAPLFEHFELDKKWLLYASLATGLALTFVAGVDIMAAFGVTLAYPVNIIVSGILVGGGSNLLHEVIDFLETLNSQRKALMAQLSPVLDGYKKVLGSL